MSRTGRLWRGLITGSDGGFAGKALPADLNLNNVKVSYAHRPSKSKLPMCSTFSNLSR